MSQILTRNNSTDCGEWKDPNCFICTEYVERAPDPATVKFHYCDKDGLGSINLTDLITLLISTDTDGDGLSDLSELLIQNTDPNVADTDADGLSDGEEVNVINTDPLDIDSDDDGLTDGAEVNIHNTNPLNADTDGGGVNDGDEVMAGADPNDPTDDPCIIAKTSPNKIDVTIGTAGNATVYQAWSASSGVATLAITIGLPGNQSTIYVIPNTSVCATNDSNFTEIPVGVLGNTSSIYLLNQGI